MAQFTNQAQLSYNNSIINSNIAVGEVLEALSATKSAIIDQYSQSDNVTYVISIINSSASTLSGITVTDNLGAYDFDGQTLYPLSYINGSARVYVGGVLQSTPTVSAGPPLAVSGLTIPANSNLILIYEAEVTPFAPLDAGTSILNTATISGGGIINPITVNETILPTEEPNLTITKSVSPVPVTENGTLTYSFTIQNTGNTAAVATDDVTLTDVFDPILSGITVSYNGTTLTPGVDYTYDEGTGVFSTTPGVITVPAATYSQNPDTGVWITTPGVVELTVSGTI